MKLVPLLFSLSLIAFASAPTDKTLESVQNKWDETKSYQADFKQTIFNKRLGTKEEATGSMSISRPGKIRWDSMTDRTLQILNGKKLYDVHFPKRRKANIVNIYEDITKKADIRPLAFLSGKATFRKSYHVDILKESKGSVDIKLVPKDVPGGETYIAEFDKNSYLLAALTTETAESRVRIEFSNIKANVDLKDDVFEYKPSPLDVVTVNK